MKTAPNDKGQEWARAEQIEALFGLRPSFLRKLGQEGRIKMRLIAPPGAKKGVRLYQIASVRSLIEHE